MLCRLPCGDDGELGIPVGRGDDSRVEVGGGIKIEELGGPAVTNPGVPVGCVRNVDDRGNPAGTGEETLSECRDGGTDRCNAA
jgi:hypothetical protein